MLLLVFYAVVSWYATALWRRRWQGFAIVLGSVLGVACVAVLHRLIDRWSGHTINLPAFHPIIYPYGVVVGGMGLYIACIPRRKLHGHCAACEYSLEGLDDAQRVCPECGVVIPRSAADQPVREGE